MSLLTMLDLAAVTRFFPDRHVLVQVVESACGTSRNKHGKTHNAN